MNVCKSCIKENCKKRDTIKGLCFGKKLPPDQEICCYFEPACAGQTKQNCGYWNGICKCPQEQMQSK